MVVEMDLETAANVELAIYTDSDTTMVTVEAETEYEAGDVDLEMLRDMELGSPKNEEEILLDAFFYEEFSKDVILTEEDARRAQPLNLPQ